MSETNPCACAANGSKPSGSCQIQNGKGDAPRNISKKFRSNYDAIRWSSGGKKRKEGTKMVFTY
jgi:hypothetical protein